MKNIISGVVIAILGLAVLLYNRSQVAVGNSEPNNLLVIGPALLAMLIGLVIITYGVVRKISVGKSK